MIAEVKGARLLQGFRGWPAADLAAFEDILVRVPHLAMHMEGHLAELDINPLKVLPSGQGVKAIDALVASRHIALRVTESRTQKFAGLIVGSSGSLWNSQPSLSLGGGNRSRRP